MCTSYRIKSLIVSNRCGSYNIQLMKCILLFVEREIKVAKISEKITRGSLVCYAFFFKNVYVIYLPFNNTKKGILLSIFSCIFYHRYYEIHQISISLYTLLKHDRWKSPDPPRSPYLVMISLSERWERLLVQEGKTLNS